MSWFGNLEGVGDLSEEDKELITEQHKFIKKQNYIYSYFPIMGMILCMGIIIQSEKFKNMILYGIPEKRKGWD